MSCSLTERVPENAGAGSGAGAAGAGVGGTGTGCRLRGSANAKQSGGSRSSGGGKRAAATANSTSNGGGGGGSTGGTAGADDAAAGPSPPRPKPCLCWCCCCGCNCSTPGKGSDENGPSKNSNSSDINCEDEPPISIEEIRTWGRSFDRLMRSAGGRKVFREFLKCEYSEENILFWMACEDLKAETNAEGVEEKARTIYEDYISILSPKEVSLDSRVREIVNRNMMDPTPTTFDEAQLQIYTLMHRDSYPRFVNSAMYKQLAQTQHQQPAAGSESSGDNTGAVKETTETTSTG